MGDDNRRYPFIGRLERIENEANELPKHGLGRWLTPLFKDQVSFCQACESRQLDFRPLIKKPPQFKRTFKNSRDNRNIVDNNDLNDLEMKNAVYINDFSFQEAKARKQCSLCMLLVSSLKWIEKAGWLLYMSCVCILRPRYDCAGEKMKIVHRHQVWLGFQPVEKETFFDMIYVNKFGFARKGRCVIPSAIDFKLPRDWLQQCDRKHSHPAIPSALRSRMQAIMDRGLFRVINTSTRSVEIMTSIPKFVALSYVWGTPLPGSPNYQPLKGWPMPSTISDATIIASSIGFKWIWVDRICIDQNSSSEKAILIPYIKDIFATAQLTIVAGCGKIGASSALMGSPRAIRDDENLVKLDSSIALLPVGDTFWSEESVCVWSTRGWTFEEFVFSRRLLFVFPAEIFFLCGSYTFRESVGHHPIIPNKDKVDRDVLGEDHVSDAATVHSKIQRNPAQMSKVLDARTFVTALEDYSSRDLTVEEDRIPAVAGVIIAALTNPIDEISERALLRHGHPLRFFEILLTWVDFSWGRDPSPIPNKPFVPSWSWASSHSRACFTCQLESYIFLEPNVSWFQYSSLHNHDILGLPTEHNLISDIIQLKLPDGLITGQPWMESLSDGLPPDREGRPSISSSVDGLLSLPKLHLITVVFDARFVQWKHPERYRQSWYEHVLISVGSTETSDDIYNRFHDASMMRQWSIHPELEPHYSSQRIGSRPSPFESFAIITGRAYYKKPNELYYNLYIMLLDRIGPDGTYKRVGLAPLVEIKEGSYFIEVIKNGRPRWEYICLV